MRAIMAGHIEGYNPDAARPGCCEYDHNVAMVDAIMRSARVNILPIVSHASPGELSIADRHMENNRSIDRRIIECEKYSVTESVEVHNNIALGSDPTDYALILWKDGDPKGRAFADHLHANIRPFLERHGVQRVLSRPCGTGTRWGYYEAVCMPHHTALILEVCFMSNPAHGPLIDDPAIVQAYADLIGYAIGSYNG